MNRILIYELIALLFFITSCTTHNQSTGRISQWLTTPDRTTLFEEGTEKPVFSPDVKSKTVIDVDTTQQFQTIDGFGYAVTGGSAYLLHRKLNPQKRTALLRELFLSDGKNIGISYLRISVGASDLDDHVFSYDDLPAGASDMDLKQFTLAEDQKDLIPILKEIIQLNPSIKIMGSPWSAPAWMKTNENPKGGSLKLDHFDVYARYLVRYISAMASEGIVIDALTLQNEPENPKNNPSMLMTAAEQARFVKENLGPAFAKAGIATKIIVFDHNCDHPDYPMEVLNDAAAKKYIDGSAFHMYLGNIDALSKVHAAHPDRSVYFTEQWTSSKGKFGGDLQWHVKNLIIGATRNWSRTVLEWNLAADPNDNPHTTDGGCTECLGALTIGDSVRRNVSYYIIAHASKFVRPGSIRIQSSTVEGLSNVAFITPDQRKVLIVLNETGNSKSFAIGFGGKKADIVLVGGAVGTYVW